MRVLVHGAGGHMGRIVCDLAQNGSCGATLAARVSPELETNAAEHVFSSLEACGVPADVIVDFSAASAIGPLCDYAVRTNTPLVVATTGHNEAGRTAIEHAARQIPVFFAANMSVGVALLIRLAQQAAKMFPSAQIEIVETHHCRKLDAPSGTALAIAHGLQEVRPELTLHCGRSGMHKREENEIGIQSIRYGNVVGEHEVIVSAGSQTIRLKHEAHDRALFAEGALAAAQYLITQNAGLYQMNDLLRSQEE